MKGAAQSFNLEFGRGPSAGFPCDFDGDTEPGKLEEGK